MNSVRKPDILEQVRKFADAQTEKYEVPSLPQVELANRKGQWLAEALKADKEIVILGTLLKDCMLGQAMKEGRMKDHAEMGKTAAGELLSKLGLSETAKANVLACVEQHHGVKKFYSLEAEICCNADCYLFASVEGVIGSINYLAKWPVPQIVKLFSEKADEKWQAATLDIVKKELAPQYKVIKEFLGEFK